MKVYVLEIRNEFGGFEFDAVYSDKELALENVNFWELEEGDYIITEHEV